MTKDSILNIITFDTATVFIYLLDLDHWLLNWSLSQNLSAIPRQLEFICMFVNLPEVIALQTVFLIFS